MNLKDRLQCRLAVIGLGNFRVQYLHFELPSLNEQYRSTA